MSFATEKDLGVPFSAAARKEATDLVAARRVKILEGSRGNFFEADVPFFKRFHRVWIQRTPTGTFEFECTCPTLENTGQGCAHVLALALAIEAQVEDAKKEALAEIPLTPLYVLLPRGAAEALVTMFEDVPTENGVPHPLVVDAETLVRIRAPEDVAAMKRLEVAAKGRRPMAKGGGFVEASGPWSVPAEGRLETLKTLAKTGRLRFGSPTAKHRIAVPEDRAPLELVLTFLRDANREGRLRLQAQLFDGEKLRPVEPARLLAADRKAMALLDNEVVPIETFGAHEWLALLARGKEMLVPERELSEFLERLGAAGPLPRLAGVGDAPPLPLEVGTPRGHLRIRHDGPAILADLAFNYGDRTIPPESGARLIYLPAQKLQVRRDLEAEARLQKDLGAGPGIVADPEIFGRFEISRSAFETVLAHLLDAGFVLDVEGKRTRRASRSNLSLRSGLDWFELEGRVNFEGGAETDLLRALEVHRHGGRFVTLDDGSLGLLPEDELSRLERLRELVGSPEDRLRFRRSQALLLEPVLATEFSDASDRDLASLHQSLVRLNTPEPRPAPAGFLGTLRSYQERGFSWLRSLADAGIGGCLADDMGLGKTVQALALLLSLEETPPTGFEAGRPHLIVCPRSLLWNWREEARRFAPSLRLVEHHGTGRATTRAELEAAKLILTTYGTLQRDLELFSSLKLGLVLLDEAQAIKNPKSKNAEAVRGLSARFRLSLTGTPIENHLRDLWSQMEFLNPGLLGTEQRFLETLSDPEAGSSRALLARALHPLILRRTKEEVLSELPPKVELTLKAPLSAEQERLYAALLAEARQKLTKTVGEEGGFGSRFHVLESLLRLRQAACHPGLIDPKLQSAASGKLDLLLDELDEVVAGGHKALVFSQFTSFLGLVKPALEARSLVYAYLDGATSKREEVVRRFQEDPECKVFLISLKAGGVGLNLTAADYVFILDPWWNPAVEAQAIDRAHRIGQEKRVFAYRLVSEGTIEERILDLQAKKRELADAILAADSGPLAAISEEDLRLLLS